MARSKSYGYRMAEFDRHSDATYWRSQLCEAANKKPFSFEELEELVKEGVEDDFMFPDISDPYVDSLINSLREKYEQYS